MFFILSELAVIPLNIAALDCGKNAQFSYEKPCPRTCQHDPELPVPCSEPATWVCMCKDGFVLR